MRRTRERTPHPEPVVELRGTIGEDLGDYARRKVGAALAHVHRPVEHVHIRVVRSGDPARERPVTARATVGLDGETLQVHADAARPREAVDRLVDRLDQRLERMAVGWEARRGRIWTDRPHEWRHDFPPAPRRPGYPRPAEEREIIRHTTASPVPCPVDEAVAEMDDLEQDFHLFVEATRGVDSIVYRGGPTGVRLAQTDGRADRVPPGTVPITISTTLPPLLDVPEAIDRIERTGLPFLFYLDGDHGRGCVLHHRRDGHYGLVDPMAEGAASNPD